MSFLDCMSCGFGAVILFFMIINAHGHNQFNQNVTTLTPSLFESLINVVKLPVTEVRVGSPHNDRSIADFTGKP